MIELQIVLCFPDHPQCKLIQFIMNPCVVKAKIDVSFVREHFSPPTKPYPPIQLM